MTVMVFLMVGFHDVASLIVLGSLIKTSTPGGTDSAVRPSLDGRFEVDENARRAVFACHAGTRNAGSVTVGALNSVWPNALPRLGAIIAAIEVALRSHQGLGW